MFQVLHECMLSILYCDIFQLDVPSAHQWDSDWNRKRVRRAGHHGTWNSQLVHRASKSILTISTVDRKMVIDGQPKTPTCSGIIKTTSSCLICIMSLFSHWIVNFIVHFEILKYAHWTIREVHENNAMFDKKKKKINILYCDVAVMENTWIWTNGWAPFIFQLFKSWNFLNSKIRDRLLAVSLCVWIMSFCNSYWNWMHIVSRIWVESEQNG